MAPAIPNATEPTQVPNVVAPTVPAETPAPQPINTSVVEKPQFASLQMLTELDGWGVTDGAVVRTNDGGATWDGVYSRKIDDAGWSTVGLDVTTNYGVHFDLFDSKRIFITYTDIGAFRSEDGGTSWTSATMGVPDAWTNTTY